VCDGTSFGGFLGIEPIPKMSMSILDRIADVAMDKVLYWIFNGYFVEPSADGSTK
jgi:hypothetical protein